MINWKRLSKCRSGCQPDRSLYNTYLESLVATGNLEKADEIFNEIYDSGTIGATARSCDIILGGYLASGEFDKAERIYDIMRKKRYDVDPGYTDKLQHILSMKKKVVQRRVSMQLDQEQREILVGMLLGGLHIESDEPRRNHAIHFEFSENSEVHDVLKIHIHGKFYEWLTSSSRSVDEDSEIPHSYSAYYAKQFRMKNQVTVPKVIHIPQMDVSRILAYWYMFGGFRISSGDILLKLKAGKREDVERIVKALQAKTLACKVKRKGRVFWIGLQGRNAVLFWETVEPYILESIKDHLIPLANTVGRIEGRDFDLDTESENDQGDN